jgi:hypothetical protein
VILPQECLDAGGFFSGANTLCTPGASCLSGACCLLNGTCEERFDFLCEPPDDHFLGPDTLCEANFCVAGDCNNDGVVNLDDYARLATCLSPSGGPDALLGDECRCIDLDHDGDVDLRDAATFWSAMTPIP